MTPVAVEQLMLITPPVREGNAVRLLNSGQAFFPELFSLIEQAREDIRIETYILADDAIGQQLEAALLRAVQRGVSVQMVVDGFGSAPVVASLVPRLQGIGVQVRVFRPEPQRIKPSPRRLRRLHRKIVVVDRTVAMLGGINLVADDNHVDAGEDNWERMGMPLGPRYDFAVRVEGPVAHDVWLATEWLWWQIGPAGEVTDSLTATWWRQRANDFGHIVQESLALPMPAAAGAVRAALVLKDNLRFRRSIERAYLQAIGQSHSDIWIANAYFLPSSRLRKALSIARLRGVKVNLLLQGLVQNPLQHYATLALYDELLRNGISIYEYTRSFLHAKVAVVDQTWATVGSSNLDPFSLLVAREANLLVHDSTFVEQLRSELVRASVQDARPVTWASVKNRTLPERMLSRLALVAVRLAVVLTGRLGRY